MDSISERQFQIWWAYYQCEPFGSHWEQAASVMSVVHANSAMLAATRGAKMEPLSVLDFMPSDSMKWQKRKKLKSSRIKHPKIQAEILKKAFGFS